MARIARHHAGPIAAGLTGRIMSQRTADATPRAAARGASPATKQAARIDAQPPQRRPNARTASPAARPGALRRALPRAGGCSPSLVTARRHARGAARGPAHHRLRLQRRRIALVDSYFAVMLAVVAVLAAASAPRYYLVITLGERVVADLARVFRISSRCRRLLRHAPAPANWSRASPPTRRRSSRPSAPPPRSRCATSCCSRRRRHDGGDEPEPVGLVLLAIPLIVLPLVASGRAVRRARATRRTRSPMPRLCRRADRRDAHHAGLHRRAAGARRFGGAVERAFDAARSSTRARAFLTAVAIFLIFASVVAVLWYGAHDVLAGRITPGGSASSCSTRCSPPVRSAS